MASSQNTTQDAPLFGEDKLRNQTSFLRLVAVITVFSIGMPPLPLIAATWDAPPTSSNPFAWPPPFVPLPAQVPSEFAAPPVFPAFALSPVASPVLAELPAEEPWMPGDLDPIAPPDGMPVQGGPVGLALLENAVGNGIIVGEVSDATTLDPVPGALVEIVGTGRTVEADAQGRFQFGGLPAGTFNIQASQLSYFDDTTVVTVVEGSPSEVRFGLRSRPTDDSSSEFTLEEETVVGDYQGDSAGDFNLELAMDSPNIGSGIGKDDFGKSGVSDAGDAVSKISGANIVGGRYAVVRGLGDRYSNTLVNKALISSADPSKKAIQLDLFPSDLLESVSIFKTFTPDLPAEFAGGTVVIETLRFPKERLVEFGFGTGWNSNFSGADMRTIQGREFDFFGETGDSFPASAGTTLQGLTTGYTGTRNLATATPAQRARAAEAAAIFTDIHLSAPMRPGRRGVEPNQDLSLLLGETFKLGEEVELGAVLGFTWSKSDSIREDVITGRQYNPGSDGLPGTGDERLNRSGIEDQFKSSLNWGALASLGLKVSDRHELGFTYFSNNTSEDQVTVVDRQRRQDGDNLAYLDSSRTPGGAGGYLYTSSETLEPLRRELELRQLNGKHVLGDPDGKAPTLEWAYSQSDSLEDRPHSRSLFFYTLDYTDPRIRDVQGDIYRPELGVLITASDLPSATQGTGTLNSFRETLKTEESAENARADLTIPLFKRDSKNFFEFKLGANRITKEREVRGRFFTYSIPTQLNNQLFSGLGEGGVAFLDSFDSAFNPDGTPKFNGWTGTGGRNGSDRLFLEEATKSGRTVRNVDAFSEIEATYLMSTLALDEWNITGGFRIEEDTRGYEVLAGLNNGAFVTPRIEQNNRNLLPGIIIRRSLDSDGNINATFAWSRTIARPTFYEFAPVQTQDQSTGDIIVGNPNLVDTLIDNFDLKFDWAVSQHTAFSVGLFHKSMEDPIAQAFDLTRKTWLNGTEGSLQGVELEARKRFGEAWNLSGNYTFINSQLQYEQPVGSSGIQLIDSSFEGQPEHIFNLILGYDLVDSGFSASLVYNFTGSYLTGVPLTNNSPSIRREAYRSLDLILSQRLPAEWCDGTVKLKFGNILDETDTESFEDTDLIYRSYKPGRSVSLSLDLEF